MGRRRSPPEEKVEDKDRVRKALGAQFRRARDGSPAPYHSTAPLGVTPSP
jgi:hypothetical protein